MEKVAIFGGTGRTGKHLVEQVAARGIIPICLVREKSKEKITERKAFSIIGSPLEYEDVLATIEGCDAVLVALNIARKSDWPWAKVVTPPNLLDIAMKNIVKAMNDSGVRRVITVSAWGVGDSYSEVNWMFRFLINKTKVGIAYAGHEDQEKVLRQSGLDWTAVRPVGLTNENWHSPIRVSFKGENKLRMTINRKDVAKFMLDILEDKKYFQTTPSISMD
ncbi:MAG: NAD(P)H-binding protein [Bacteroidia bacterium]|nr:NAD(P)H-binding protein [Bacteroidia bacterium]